MKRIYNFINQESPFENEPKRVFVLLRWLYLLKMLYFSVFFVLMLHGGPNRFSTMAVVAFLAMVVLFQFTYRLRTKYNLIVYAVVQIVWILSFLYLYGWDCGVQHFIFTLLVVIYFAVYDSLSLKIICTVGLFLLRFVAFCYCRAEAPYVELSESFVVLMQIYNSMFLFMGFGLICGIFSSNIESAEKKLVQYNTELKHQASTDPLTNIWNRRTMLHYIETFREQNPEDNFVMAMGDIDFFKRINDCWGHECGDLVLKEVTDLFRREVAESGKVCRWGGEEFLFFFPGKNGDEVYMIVSDLAMQIQRKCILWNENPISITMTFGIEENDYHSSLDKLIQNVDEKLYLGKENGRNRVVF